MARFLRCVGVDNVAYHVNLDQVAWVFRPHGANHTVIKLCGAETITVREPPQHITGHADEHHEHHDTTSMHRSRMGVG
jgi:hypothetical protein